MKKNRIFYFSFYFFLVSAFSLNAQDPNPKPSITSNGSNWFELMQNPNSKYAEVVNAANQYFSNKDINQKGIGYKVFKRWEYINESHVLPDGKLQAPDYILRTYQEYMKEIRDLRSVAGTWSIVGPVTYPTNSSPQPTGMGRLNTIAFHPTDANTIYVGASSGGIWKTTNHGATWTNLSANIPKLGVSSILIHPTNPDIIYIGTGDRDGSDAPGIGVYKSTDGGATWLMFNTGMGNAVVGAMIMNPGNSNIIVAATNKGIFKTTNGGISWAFKSSFAANFKEIIFKPGDFTTMYTTGNGRFFRSTNSGDSWTEITSGISAGGRMVIGVSPANSALVYVCRSNPDNSFGGVYLSSDAGLNFTTKATSPNIFGYACDGSGTSSQASYDLCIEVDPTDANIVYIGSINNWKSTDGGNTFNPCSHWVGSGFAPTDPTANCAASVHADQHKLAWSPHNNNLYVGNDGGLYYTADGGSTWPEISSGLSISQSYKIGQSATDVNMMMSGYQDNGATFNNGSSFNTIGGGDGGEQAFDYLDTDFRYSASTSGYLDRTENGDNAYIGIAGINSNGITGESNYWTFPFMLHEANPDTMFLGYKQVYRSSNVKLTTPTWTAISSGETVTCRVLEQSPANVDILYVYRLGSLKRSDNANAAEGSVTWTSCTPPSGAIINDLETHPTNENIVYATAGFQVFRSADKGITWSNITNNLPVLTINTIVIDNNANEGLYIGNQTGVWYKDATMANWMLYSSGLPPVDVRELEIYYDVVSANSRIKAATYGRGLWQSDLAEVNVIAPSNFTAFVAGTSQVNLNWTKNVANDNVIIAWNSTESFGHPAEGVAYTAGNTLPSGGGTVLYVGPLSVFNHTSLTAGTTYFYKIWSVNGSNLYSAGVGPIEATTDCIPVSTFPYLNTFDDISCWKIRDNTNTRSWEIGFTTNATNPPTILTSPYAYFRSNPGTNPVNFNTDLISPPFDFSSLSSVALKFKLHYDSDNTWSSIATLSYTIDNGITWNSISTYTTDQNNTSVTFNLPSLAGQSNVKFKWNYFDDAIGSYMWGIDDVELFDNGNSWTGVTSTDWFTVTNWAKGSLPTNTENVIIPSTAPNQPAINGAGTAVCLDVYIQSGASLTMSATTGYTLSVSGDWTNSGTFNRGIGTIDFNGSNALQQIKGASTTDFQNLKVTKGSINNILEAISLVTLNAASNPLVITSGTFKLSSASTITPFTSQSGAELTSSKCLWNNGGTINYGNFSWFNSAGTLRISAGTINSGTQVGNHIIYLNSGKFIIEGGTLNIAGALRPNSGVSTGMYAQSGGTVIVCTAGTTNTDFGCFDMNAGVPFSWTGGNIVIPRASSSTTADVNIFSTTNSVTGGTLLIGNASTPAGQIIRINSSVAIQNLTLNDVNSPKLTLVNNDLRVKGEVMLFGGMVDIPAPRQLIVGNL